MKKLTLFLLPGAKITETWDLKTKGVMIKENPVADSGLQCPSEPRCPICSCPLWLVCTSSVHCGGCCVPSQNVLGFHYLWKHPQKLVFKDKESRHASFSASAGAPQGTPYLHWENVRAGAPSLPAKTSPGGALFELAQHKVAIFPHTRL